MMASTADLEYVGFWARVGASLIDTILLLFLLVPLLTAIYGRDYWLRQNIYPTLTEALIDYVLPAVAVIAFWMARQATPGKMVIGARIVDASTGGPLRSSQAIVRYIGYYISALFLCLGFVWVAFDRRKQGWHDKLAGTVVVRSRGALPVRFPEEPPAR